MAKEAVLLQAFNRGIISPLALARTDLDRTRLSAETQTNWIPRTLGSMMLRPGWQYIATTDTSQFAIHIPFIYATDDTAYLQLTDQSMRVFVSDAAISRTSVSTTVTNGSFDSDLINWTNDDDAGATSSWLTGGYMALLGTGFASARRQQTIAVAVNDRNVAHAIRVVVGRGPVVIRVGSTVGGEEYFGLTLGTGTHSLAFTPTTDFEVEISSDKAYTTLVNSFNIEGPGTVELPTPWLEADLRSIRWTQSADVIFLACDGYQQRKILRYGTTSWSVVLYEPEDGPFKAINTTGTSISSSAISGDVTLTASSPLWKSTNVGGLYKINSIGQTVSLDVTAAAQFTDYIRVTGVDNNRKFVINVLGTWAGTVTLQRSVSEPGDWADVVTYTSNQTNLEYDDGLDNQIIYYRIGIDTGEYTSGTAELDLTYSSGSNTGIVRITAFTSTQSVSAVVLNNLGGTSASTNWYEGEWSDRRGWPSSVALPEGRLAFAGKSKVILSVSDAYESFDNEVEGDAGPINRTIGSGPVDGTNWLFAGNRLVVGTDGAEASVRSSSFDEPLTPTAFNIRFPSTMGSANVPIVKVDSTGIFVDRSETGISRLIYNDASYDYQSSDMTALVPEIGDPGIVRVAVQRYPDTRIHCVRSDGTVAMMVDDPAEEVSCWVEIETDGEVEDVFVMPGTVEDRVYYCIKRTINGSTVRYLEKWALESECVGGAVNKQADSFAVYTDAASTTITGLSHLIGEEVIAWANGVDISPDDSSGVQTTYTVSGAGTITIATAATNVVVGLPYKARYKSSKLAYAAEDGTALTQRKRVFYLGLIMHNTHSKGIKYGPDFDNLDPMPDMEAGTSVSYDTIHSMYDKDGFEFNGEWDTDSRVCVEAKAPRPCTLLAMVVGIQTNEKDMRR